MNLKGLFQIGIAALFLMVPRAGFGDGATQTANFSEFINSPEGLSENPPDKSPGVVNHAAYAKTVKAPHKKDVKPALLEIPAQWKACTVDSDCTAGVADCVSWEGLNKKYLPGLSKNLSSCSASIDPGFQPQAACVAKSCRITDKNTDISWEEWLRERRMNR